ncbi:MAG: ATP-binding cassette domain-containing protein [Xenococcaceae cyanobacterium]
MAREEIFRILGFNGARKSTTISMLISLSKPSQGSIEVAGYDLAGASNSIKKSS